MLGDPNVVCNKREMTKGKSKHADDMFEECVPPEGCKGQASQCSVT
jgi:hypothetical protein